jgi:hypothetical protein
MKIEKQRLRIKADNLFKQAILLKNNGRCEVCGSTFGVTGQVATAYKNPTISTEIG